MWKIKTYFLLLFAFIYLIIFIGLNYYLAIKELVWIGVLFDILTCLSALFYLVFKVPKLRKFAERRLNDADKAPIFKDAPAAAAQQIPAQNELAPITHFSPQSNSANAGTFIKPAEGNIT